MQHIRLSNVCDTCVNYTTCVLRYTSARSTPSCISTTMVSFLDDIACSLRVVTPLIVFPIMSMCFTTCSVMFSDMLRIVVEAELLVHMFAR